jgi:acyl-CoA synthetase (AMP-forming)/AMP-acid ligase II
MVGLLRDAVARHGDCELIVTPHERATYTELDQRSSALARRLLRGGVGKGSRVGILATFGADWLTAFLAVTRVGAIAFPMATTATAAEAGRAVRFADIQVLITPRELTGRDQQDFLADALPSLARSASPDLELEEAPYLRRICVLGATSVPWAVGPDELAGPSGPVSEDLLARAEAEVAPADLMVLIATSGSTADPKGVLHTHGTVVRQTSLGEAATGFPAIERSRVLCGLPLFWTGGIQTVCGAMHLGVTLVCQERFEPAEAIELIRRERVTHASVWPTLWQRLVAAPGFDDLPLPLTSLSGVGTPAGPDGAVRTRLGMTETLGPHSGTGYTDYRVIDPATDEVLAADALGEICVRGFAVTAGLVKQEREDVFDPDGYYRTGDRGYVRDGWVHFAGRMSEMIKTNGANVAPPEVEATLMRHGSITQSFVFGLPDAERGELVVAAVVPADPAVFDVDDLARYAHQDLSSYKVPRRWVVIDEGEIPLTATSKADRRALRQHVAARLSDSTASTAHPSPARSH